MHKTRDAEAEMRLCIPAMEATGLQARVSGHFGGAPYFTLVEASSGRTEVVENAHARHEHGQCRPTQSLEGRGVDVVVCRGLGRRALGVLREDGIRVFVAEAETVSEAVRAFASGVAVPLDEAHACRGGHEHGRF